MRLRKQLAASRVPRGDGGANAQMMRGQQGITSSNSGVDPKSHRVASNRGAAPTRFGGSPGLSAIYCSHDVDSFVRFTRKREAAVRTGLRLELPSVTSLDNLERNPWRGEPLLKVTGLFIAYKADAPQPTILTTSSREEVGSFPLNLRRARLRALHQRNTRPPCNIWRL